MTTDELDAALTIQSEAKDKKPSFFEDGSKKTFTVIQTPALSVTVAEDAKFYDTTTADELKAALTVESIAKDGTKTTVTDFSIDKTELTAGDNMVTVTAGGLSETVTIKAEEDAVEKIEVTTQPNKLTYTSGEKLDLSDMVITATCKSGKTKVVTGYTANIENGTALTFANHDGKKITVTADGKTAETNALTVNKITVEAPTAEGTYTYTGSEQSFQFKDSKDKDYYEVVVKVGDKYELATADNLKGTAAGTYTAEARLKTLGEMQWSDNTTAPKTLTWEIKANANGLTVELPADATYTYTGNEQKPNVTVKSGNQTLTAEDYTVSYSDNTNAGIATVTVTGKGNYEGATGTATFTIAPVQLTIKSASAKDREYNGSSGVEITKVEFNGLVGSDTVTYTATGSMGDANVGSGKAVTVWVALDSSVKNYTLSSATTTTTTTVTINANDVTATRETTQSIVKGVGTFTEPAFGEITGTLIYSYNSTTYDKYDTLVAALKDLEKGTTGTISYTYTASGNYTGTITGSINFTVVDILFTVGDAPATAPVTVENALTIKESITYGDNWSDIVKFKEGVTITATVNGQTDTDQSHFTLKETGRPDAGDGKTYTIVYNGTINNVKYENATVITGTVNVAKKELTVSGLAVKSKTYDGKTNAELDYTSVVLNGKLDSDDVQFADSKAGVIATFADANAGTDKNVNLTGSFTLIGTDKDNYTLTQPTSLTGTITAKTLTITDATAESRDYVSGKTDVKITEVTFDGVVGTDEVGYTATGTMTDDSAGAKKNVDVTVTISNSNYTLGEQITTTTQVEIKKINWDDQTTIKTSGKYGSTVTVDVSFLPEYTKAAAPTVELLTVESESSTELKLKLTDDRSKIDKTAKYILKLEEVINYNPFTLTVEITILDKDTQTLTADAVSKTYGDVFTVSVNGAKTDVTYAVKSGSGDFLSYAEGKFTALKSGTATIVATAAETADYQGATVEIPVTIAKREMTVTANDASIYVGETVPTLTYTVSGMLSGDSWGTEPTLFIPGTVDTNEIGEYEIAFSDPGAPTGDYHITFVNGKLSITARPIVVPPSGNAVTVSPVSNGRVNVSTGSASAGGTVTITTTPNQGYELGDLLVTDRLGNQLPVTDLGNGRFSFVMPAASVTVSATFTQVKQSGYYADVLPSDWYYDAVQYVTEQGLMSGTGKGFEPGLTTSRAMIWTILARMDGVDTTVASGSWYAIAQTWAMANGVSDGTDPNGLITREQLAAMLYRYAVSKGIDVSVGEDTNILSYADATSVSEWAVSAMQWACGAGIINGVDGSLLPQGNATRAQTATMLMRYLELVK